MNKRQTVSIIDDYHWSLSSILKLFLEKSNCALKLNQELLLLQPLEPMKIDKWVFIKISYVANKFIILFILKLYPELLVCIAFNIHKILV